MFVTRWVYQPPTVGRRLTAAIAGVVGASAAILIAAIAGGASIDFAGLPGLMVQTDGSGSAITAAVLAQPSCLVLWDRLSRRRQIRTG